MSEWTLADAARVWGVDDWGRGVFRITPAGRVASAPTGAGEIDLFELVESLRERDLHPPLLIRLYDVLEARLREIRGTFDEAVRAHGYRGRYRCVYPIKVNQERYLCEEVRDLAVELDFGLEAGSKPELLAVLGLTADHPKLPIVCNGFKDDEFIETVVLATKLGRDIVPIVEKPNELGLVLKHARAYGVRPKIGARVKLHARGTGRWESSGGARSKFGLFATELLELVETLRAEGMTDCLELLHCHVGSQVSELEALRHPLEELARVHVELTRMGAAVRTIDVGGGLGIDYDGSRSGRGSSIDYGVREYADLVISTLGRVCDEAGVAHPDVLSESGRAMVASSSVLVIEVVGKSRFERAPSREDLEEAAEGAPLPESVEDLWQLAEASAHAPVREAYVAALEARDRAMTLFREGTMRLRMRALVEALHARIAYELAERVAELDEVPPELVPATKAASDVYFGNFSIFQSVPDSWALDQVFPICPIHRLGERPTRDAVLADISCDSDGEMDRFAVEGGESATLPVHELVANEPYYLGIFLVGAYQEILGDLHNLLGDTHAVHVRLDEDGQVELDEVVPGDTVREVLAYVQYDVDHLLDRLRREVESAIRKNVISVAEGKGLLSNFALGLSGYTYLE